MSRHNKKAQPGRRNPPRQQNLEKMDTFETTPITEKKQPRDDVDTETPYRGEPSEKYIKWSDVIKSWKLTAGVVAICIAVAVYILDNNLWIKGIEKDVEYLQKDVSDIKSETDELVKNTIKQDGELSSIKKSVNNIEFQLRKKNSEQNKIPENKK